MIFLFVFVEPKLPQWEYFSMDVSAWHHEEFHRFQHPTPDKPASSCNPEKNGCFHTMVRPVISYYCHVKSVYMNTQLNWNRAYVKNDSLTSPSPQSITSLVNYLYCSTQHWADIVCQFTPMFSFTLTYQTWCETDSHSCRTHSLDKTG